ncbi:MAG: nuclear transport factor 2 family protein [Acidimicrobiales bacterium]
MPLTIEDRLEITELVARYNHAVDSGDGEAFAGTFTDDGALDVGARVIEGRAALAAFAAQLPENVRAPRHIASNLLIDGNDGAATLSAYVQMFSLTGDPPRQAVAASGLYDDRLVKIDGRWRFERRVFVADRDREG